MNYKIIWKISLAVVLLISAVMFAPSLFKLYELSDDVTRILGAADIIALFILLFSFVKSYTKR